MDTHLTSAAPRNMAAWALKAKQRPFVVSSAPYYKPPNGHVVVRVNDVAANPIDWMVQDQDPFHAKYPTVLGVDVAGEIAEVANDVTGFQLGTRVIANCIRAEVVETVDLPAGATGGFQKFVVVQAKAVSELPDTIPSSVGVVLPLGIATAAAGLFQKHFLALPYPSPKSAPKPLGRVVLIWGGSSSVGSCAIQLAVAAGAEVVTTASPQNFQYCKDLGAAEVFDYHAADVDRRIVKWLDGKTLAGAFNAVGPGLVPSARIVDHSKGKALVVSTLPVDDEHNHLPKSVRAKQVFASEIYTNDVGPYIWHQFMPKALAAGTVVPKPDPEIVGEGIRSIQLAVDTHKKGVSAKKIVVSYIA